MVGIGTTTITPEFQEWIKTQPKEPVGDVKKKYVVTCHEPKDWTSIHQVLLKDGTLEDNIPNQSVQCSDVKGHSSTRGTYILNQTEVADLRKHPKVKDVNIDTASYPGTYMPDPAAISDAVQQTERYTNTVKNYRGDPATFLPASPGAAEKDRTSYQLMRCQQKSNPWGNNVNQVLDDKPTLYGSAKDVDVIVADQAAWLGHIEFQNNLGGPTLYEGGNTLTRKNISTTSGSCDVLDLVLDAPYYIDPDYFNANPAARLVTRWDGTTVPDESVALGWWSDSAKRSAIFASVGTVDVANGGYTRDRSNGSNTTMPTHGSNDYHGTPCASLAYGRNYGWAFNANKWYINAYGTYGVGVEKYFDITKIFHQNKPINSTYGTRDATVTSNSFGYRKDLPNQAYHFYRKGISGMVTQSYSVDVTAAGSGAYTLSGTDKAGNVSGNNPSITCNAGDTLNFVVDASGHPLWIKTTQGTGTGNQATGVTNGGTESGTVTWTPSASGTYYYQCEYHNSMNGTINVGSQQPAGTQYTALNQVPFLDNFWQGAIRFEYVGNSMVTAGDEMIAAGVIFVCSSGNTNQKLVKADHPDYNNYWSTGPDTPYDQATTIAWGYSSYNSINRQGFPGMIGKTNANVYRTIPVGAMDTDLESTSGTGQERKIVYSNMGNLVPFYAPAYDVLSGCDSNTGTRYNRYDAYYTLNSNQSVESEDCRFGGTSAACPVACGLIATKLQYNRQWTVEDVLDWITNQVGTLDAADFFTGTESQTYDDSEWNDQNNTQGGEPIIIYDAATGNETESGDEKIQLRFRNAGGIQISGVNFINT
tara:strand:- start:6844 stop:9288 length:2445 start_codon:yes stop_codon:yes gene_type:complete